MIEEINKKIVQSKEGHLFRYLWMLQKIDSSDFTFMESFFYIKDGHVYNMGDKKEDADTLHMILTSHDLGLYKGDKPPENIYEIPFNKFVKWAAKHKTEITSG